MEWCGNITSIESFVDYFQKYYLSHRGKWKVIGVSSITGAKNRPLKQQNRKDEYDKIQSDMQKSITAILKKEFEM
jgi:hypothetical protein